MRTHHNKLQELFADKIILDDVFKEIRECYDDKDNLNYNTLGSQGFHFTSFSDEDIKEVIQFAMEIEKNPSLICGTEKEDHNDVKIRTVT